VTLRLLLIRHAETALSARGRCYGVLDVELSPRGIRRAQALADVLRHEAIDAVYSSALSRAVESARPLAQSLGQELKVEEGLGELDFGRCEGMTYSEIELHYPDVYREWMTSPATVVFPGGEGLADLQRRAWATMHQLQSRHAQGTIAVYTHAGVLRAIVARLLEMPDHAIFRLGQDYGAINVIDVTDGEATLRATNLQLDERDDPRASVLRSYVRVDEGDS
jgi:broad specificity phosphatase PhoE